MSKVTIQNIDISIIKDGNEDYISLTDMVKGKEDSGRAADIIKNWLRNRKTLEFLGAWELLYNPDFKVVEFDHLIKDAGLHTFVLSINTWVETTGAIGIKSKQGKNGGTYAHKDIAFEFGTAISPLFKLYLIKEYQRLKELEFNAYNLEWNVKRILSKVNYAIHTDAIKEYIIPNVNLIKDKQWLVYAEEADLLNVALFKCTAKQWREANPSRVLKNENIRDMASINDLAILSNLESLNSTMIKRGIDKNTRFDILVQTVNDQRKVLDNTDFIKTLKKMSDFTFVDAEKATFDQNLKGLLNTPPPKKSVE